MDEIQRSLRASLKAGPGESAREAFLANVSEDLEVLSFWLPVAIRMSEQDSWWFDRMVAVAQRYRESPEWQARPRLPGVFLRWCVDVVAGEIRRPGGRGRAAKHMRDALVCAAVEAYLVGGAGNGPRSLREACGLVAEAASIDESVVRKIWRRSCSGQQ